MIEHFGTNTIQSIKMIYSEEIIIQIPEEKRKYFFDLINSIPDDLFEGTNNPIKLTQAGTKLSHFLHNLDQELKETGMNMEPVEKKMKENNDKYKKLLRGF